MIRIERINGTHYYGTLAEIVRVARKLNVDTCTDSHDMRDSKALRNVPAVLINTYGVWWVSTNPVSIALILDDVKVYDAIQATACKPGCGLVKKVHSKACFLNYDTHKYWIWKQEVLGGSFYDI